MKQELIKVTLNDQLEPVVSARELHKTLEVKKQFTDWWKQQQGYGFEENEDFCPTLVSVPQNQYGGLQELQDYAMKLDMAKELAMGSKTKKGKEVRKYFIQVEKDFNSPEKIMARALKIAEHQISVLKIENAQQKQIIGELKQTINKIVLFFTFNENIYSY